MIEAIIHCLSAVASFVVFCMIYVFCISKPLPHFLLSPSYRKHTPTDEGIGKYKFPEGRGVVYLPDVKYRDYLKKYAVFVYGSRKYIKCKLADDVASVRYEVAAYDRKNKLIKIFELLENVETIGETKSVQLPDNTAYASVVLRSVNEEKSFSTLRYTSISQISIFSILTFVMTVICGLLARAAILSISELFALRVNIGLGTSIISSSIIGALVVLFCLTIRKNKFLVKNND